jgi:hypothetical protein
VVTIEPLTGSRRDACAPNPNARRAFPSTTEEIFAAFTQSGSLASGVGMPSEVLGELDDANAGRAPICSHCGVTALPAELSHVIDSTFVCDNADCDAFGEVVGS